MEHSRSLSPQLLPPAVEVTHLSKFYRRDPSLSAWLSAGIGDSSSNSARNHGEDSVEALSDVDFVVPKGEAFGIIGRNGAGKSTLLQILAGTLRPSLGSFRVDGRVTALLELGSGFNPDFTGRENIFLAGAIMGLPRSEMERRYASIVGFADIGSFIEQPARTYSTGMLMRVAFAVAISVSPDVLIVDEALSVGDILFQQKCSARLQELVRSGVTLLVVTHDLSFVLNTCQRALWLDGGRMRFLGAAGDCVRAYVTAMAALAGNQTGLSAETITFGELSLPSASPLNLSGAERLGDGGVQIVRAWILQADGLAGSAFRVGDWATVVLLIEARRDVQGLSGGLEVRNRHGQVVFATGLRVIRKLIPSLANRQQCVVRIRFRLELQPAQYTLDVGCGAGGEADNTWDRLRNVCVMDVSSEPGDEIVHGLVRLPFEIEAGALRA